MVQEGIKSFEEFNCSDCNFWSQYTTGEGPSQDQTEPLWGDCMGEPPELSKDRKHQQYKKTTFYTARCGIGYIDYKLSRLQKW